MPLPKPKINILFLCTANSCRSQMAEGLANHYFGPAVRSFSAGLAPGTVHPLAIRVLREIGIDISHQYSKHLQELEGIRFDYVITLCDEAKVACPIFPAAVRHHHLSIMDPARAKGSAAQVLETFRKVRKQIEQEVLDWLKANLTKARISYGSD